MPDNGSLETPHDSSLLNKIGSFVCQAIVVIQEQQPELLLEKYRNLPWRSNQHQSLFTKKLTDLLSQTPNWDALIKQLHKLLQSLLVPESFHSEILRELLEKISQLYQKTIELNGLATAQNVENELLNNSKLELNGAVAKLESSETSLTYNAESTEQKGIAVLLLDAENLHLDAVTEQFLTTVCACPIQVKIAFANWRSLGKLDVELHGRGYELIHVPGGRDNADGKMIAFGASVHEHYLKAKEVLVCSSDSVMTNLCNHLQKNGLTVYRVSKTGEMLAVWNSATGKITNYDVSSLPETSPIEKFITQLKELITTEQKKHKNYWIKLTHIPQLFQEKYNLNIIQVINKHFPNQTLQDIFNNYPAEFAIHQHKEQSEVYVTLFGVYQISEITSQPTNETAALVSKINSKSDLEQALKNILIDLTKQSAKSYINVGILGSNFNQLYGKPITEQIKSLNISGNFVKFLQSCSSFKLKQTGKGWEVTVQ